MDLHALTAISPIDGRYRNQVQHLDEYFSEFALMKYRVLVEVEYFQFLADKNSFPSPPLCGRLCVKWWTILALKMPCRSRKQKRSPTTM
ncbi:hypothetical protein [Paraflavitalea speifideaquila]|uniref:hypothetical protein n=1 Tax=Paraflavitalea speifideaquila TaxID=3076558 RepID=UPI0028E21ECA|nr:hypothetical protein [Paraflavitalea speifideiaquila]